MKNLKTIIICCILFNLGLIISCQKDNKEETSTRPKSKAINEYNQFVETDTLEGSDFITYLNNLSSDKADIALKKYTSSLNKSPQSDVLQKSTDEASNFNTKVLASTTTNAGTTYTNQQISEFSDYGGNIYVDPIMGMTLASYFEYYGASDYIYTDPIQWTVAENAFGLWQIISKETVQYCNSPYPHFTGYGHNGSIIESGPLAAVGVVIGGYSENIIQSYPASFLSVNPGSTAIVDQNIAVNVEGTYSCAYLANAHIQAFVTISLKWD